MVTWALGNNRCTAMAMTWEKVWRMRLRCSDSLVRGRWIFSGALSSCWGEASAETIDRTELQRCQVFILPIAPGIKSGFCGAGGDSARRNPDIYPTYETGDKRSQFLGDAAKTPKSRPTTGG
jgi:hypothetical protein